MYARFHVMGNCRVTDYSCSTKRPITDNDFSQLARTRVLIQHDTHSPSQHTGRAQLVSSQAWCKCEKWKKEHFVSVSKQHESIGTTSGDDYSTWFAQTPKMYFRISRRSLLSQNIPRAPNWIQDTRSVHSSQPSCVAKLARSSPSF